jgi:hypothetical protein
VAGRPLRPATDQCHGRPLPHRLANRPQAPPRASPKTLSSPVLQQENVCGITRGFPRLSPTPGQIAHVLRTRPPRKSTEVLPARLACIRHAASVDPEPGSNSPPIADSHIKEARSLRRAWIRRSIVCVDGPHDFLCWLACARDDLITSSQTQRLTRSPSGAARSVFGTRRKPMALRHHSVRYASLSRCVPRLRRQPNPDSVRIPHLQSTGRPSPLRGSLRFSEPAEPTASRDPCQGSVIGRALCPRTTDPRDCFALPGRTVNPVRYRNPIILPLTDCYVKWSAPVCFRHLWRLHRPRREMIGPRKGR